MVITDKTAKSISVSNSWSLNGVLVGDLQYSMWSNCETTCYNQVLYCLSGSIAAIGYCAYLYYPCTGSFSVISQIFILYLRGMWNSYICKGSFGYSCYRQNTKNLPSSLKESCHLCSSSHMEKLSTNYRQIPEIQHQSTGLLDLHSQRSWSSSTGGNNVTLHACCVPPAVSLHRKCEHGREYWPIKVPLATGKTGLLTPELQQHLLGKW